MNHSFYPAHDAGYDGGKPDDRNGRRDYRDDRDGRRDDDREGGFDIRSESKRFYSTLLVTSATVRQYSATFCQPKNCQ